MARSLLRQLEQIRSSGAFDDAVANANTSGVAEDTVSGTLESDMNVLRTLVKDTKGSTNWFDVLTSYFDPSDTDAGDIANKALNLENLGGNTLDAKTIILSVSADNAGASYTVSGTSTGAMITATTAYALPTVRTGLPIFASTANNGTYYDEGGADTVCRVDVLNAATDAEMQTTGGDVVYAKLHDGADFSGTGSGTDVYARFYANDVPIDLSSIQDGAPTAVNFVYPQRKIMSDMAEHEWLRTDFVNSWEGDVELIEDINDLWGYTGSSDNTSSTAGSWTNATANYALSGNPSSLQAAADAINDSVGDATYTQDNYVTDGDSLASSIDDLDLALKVVSDSVTASSSQKYIEEAASLITKNTVHPLPYSITYTPSSTAGQEGTNMDVYVGGQLLAADTGVAGVNADRDYAEVTASGIMFRFNVQSGRNITYVVRQ